MKELTKSLATIQTKLKAKKSSYNSFGKYYFRKSEDILEAIKPFLLKHGVSVVIDEQLDWVSGGDVKAIKSKYKLTASQEKQLNELKKEKADLTKA